MRNKLKDVFVAPRDFYRTVMAIVVPIMVQNGITNFVSMLDNIMVGRVGTDAMSGVSIVNQLLFVFYLCIFGGLAGIGIFTAQFWGKGDYKGMQFTLRAKLLVGLAITALGLAVLTLFGEPLIGLFLHEGGSTGDIAETLRQAKTYLSIMYLGLLPMAVTNVYSSTLRETGQTLVPMKAGIAAVLVNLTGNYILIYGHFGAPQLGVAGAAIATVLSRFVEMAIVMIWTHLNPDRNPYISGCFRSLYVPGSLIKSFLVKGAPLLFNEALWSMGITMLVQCYSIRGLSAVAALNISNTLTNLFNIVFLSMGSATAILLGQRLGSGETGGIKFYALRLAAFSILMSLASALGLILFSPFFPRIYKTTDEVRQMATGLMIVSALCMPINAFNNTAYFTIRSGGKTFITFLSDSCFCWVISVPAAYLLSRYTALPLVPLYLCVQLLDLLKSALGFALIERGTWIHDLTEYTQ